MSQLHFYVSDELEAQIRVKTKQANLPLSQYMTELVKRETGTQNHWWQFDLFDARAGDA